jgi:hypothetical protein
MEARFLAAEGVSARQCDGVYEGPCEVARTVGCVICVAVVACQDLALYSIGTCVLKKY